jgi:membrane-associated phospholipid phosphatase
MKYLLFCSLLLLGFQNSRAQKKADSTRLNFQYSKERAFQEDPSLTQKPDFRPWIVPSAMIIYGCLSVHLDALTDVNENVKNLIWNKYPHQPVTIDNYLQWVPAVAVYGLNIVGIHGEHNFVDRTMIYLLANLIMESFVYTIKEVAHVQRPNGEGYLSFPSGHTAEAFTSAEFLMQEYKNVSVWYGIGGYAVATSVAYLRMYNNKHWLNDVIAGAGFGIISTRLSYILYPKIKKIFAHTPIPNSALMPCYQNNSLGFAFVHEFK